MYQNIKSFIKKIDFLSWSKVILFISIILYIILGNHSKQSKLKIDGKITKGYNNKLWHYRFVVNNKVYSGKYGEETNTQESVGDSLDVIYYIKDPDINLPLSDLDK